MSRTRHLSTIVVLTAGAVGVSALGATATASTPSQAHEAATIYAPVYDVVKEGFTQDDGARLAATFGIGNAVRRDGSFAYLDSKRFGVLPGSWAGTSEDEDGHKVTARKLDLAALKKITTLTPEEAIEKVSGLVPVPAGFEAQPVAGYTTVEVADAKGNPTVVHNIDTAVSYQLSLGGVPVVGPGAKTRVALSGGGDVVSLTAATREVKQGGRVAVITPEAALERCAAAYGTKEGLELPTLVYYAPPLTAKVAGGVGTVKRLLPHYQCTVKGATEPTGRLIPAAPQMAPKVELTVTGSKDGITATAVARGAGPFTYGWLSSTTPVTAKGKTITYQRVDREARADETLQLTVSDANGVATTLSVALPGGEGTASTSGQAGTGAVGGELATNGIESPITEWQCAQDSANGFRSTMLAKGQTMSFDWRGNSAWSWDFKDASLGGGDASYVDDVDAVWYTGHGWPGGFTFNNGQAPVTPADARWGDRNLEWLQLESCQVLQDTTGTLDHFDRWGPAFQGVHVVNGFHTNAYCNSGTGGRFASYLWPENFLWWELRPAFSVTQAWQAMANDLEPAGVRWRSMSAMSGSIHNLDDKYWGRGTTGPDIRPGGSYPLTGFISISGLT